MCLPDCLLNNEILQMIRNIAARRETLIKVNLFKIFYDENGAASIYYVEALEFDHGRLGGRRGSNIYYVVYGKPLFSTKKNLIRYAFLNFKFYYVVKWRWKEGRGGVFTT